MATNRKVTQKPILDTDVVNETKNDKDIKSDIPVENTDNKKTFVKSRRRTSLNEFAVVNNLRPEVKAGFKAWLNGEIFHFDEEWSELYKKYMNR